MGARDEDGRANSGRLLLASNNPGKLDEFRSLLDGCGWLLVAPTDVGLSLEVEETGSSYEENATLKGRAFASASGLFALADDSGIEVDALNGAPGIFSARYGGDGLDDSGRVSRLLHRLEGVDPDQRAARFRCVLVLVAPDGRTWQSEGTCEGRLTEVPRGTGGFGYDPIFLPRGLGRTLAELPSSEKNILSHRARAAVALRPVLQRLAGTLSDG